VLCTKPVCGMSPADVEHIACCVLKIALNQSSNDDKDNFSTVVVLVCSQSVLILLHCLFCCVVC